MILCTPVCPCCCYLVLHHHGSPLSVLVGVDKEVVLFSWGVIVTLVLHSLCVIVLTNKLRILCLIVNRSGLDNTTT